MKYVQQKVTDARNGTTNLKGCIMADRDPYLGKQQGDVIFAQNLCLPCPPLDLQLFRTELTVSECHQPLVTVNEYDLKIAVDFPSRNVRRQQFW